jgi:hypothetical protein
LVTYIHVFIALILEEPDTNNGTSKASPNHHESPRGHLLAVVLYPNKVLPPLAVNDSQQQPDVSQNVNDRDVVELDGSARASNIDNPIRSAAKLHGSVHHD